MPQEFSELAALLQGQKRLLIVVHDNPDPDALASAAAMARVAQTLSPGIHVRITCEGIVGRAENRAVARILSLKLTPVSRISWNRWPLIALVDTQPRTGNNSLPRRYVPEIVIDHHPLHPRTRARFVDVRPDYGSSATILFEYLQSARASISSDLATAMCYAISTDTQDLAREGGAVDTQAYIALYPLADKPALGRIMHPRLLHEYYSTLTRAILSAFTYGNIIGTHLGKIEHPDSVSLVADLLLQHERMGWSIVTGEADGDLYISLRTLPGRAHAGRILRRVLGKRGHAGGHGTMAGGRISLKDVDEPRERLERDLTLRLVRALRRRSEVTLRPLIAPSELTVPVCKTSAPGVSTP